MWTETRARKHRLLVERPAARTAKASATDVEERNQSNHRNSKEQHLRGSPRHVDEEGTEDETDSDDKEWKDPTLESRVSVEVEEQETRESQSNPEREEHSERLALLWRVPSCRLSQE